MCSGLPEQGLTAALETSREKAAAAAATFPALVLEDSIDLPGWKILRELKEIGRMGKGERPTGGNGWKTGLMSPATQQ